MNLSWWSLTSQCTKPALLFCFWTLKASCLRLMLSFGLQKHQLYVFSSIQTFKYVTRTLIHAFLPLKTSCVRCLLNFKLQKHHSYFAFCFLITVDFITAYFKSFKSQILKLNLACLFTASKTTIVTFASAL